MAEYVKKEDVLALAEWVSFYTSEEDDYEEFECIYPVAVRLMPTADVVEVRHGRWELHGNDDDCGCSYFCSRCGFSIDEEVFERLDSTDHCNRCGARMDGDGND